MLDLSTLTYFTIKYYGTLGTYLVSQCVTSSLTEWKYHDLELREPLVSYF